MSRQFPRDVPGNGNVCIGGTWWVSFARMRRVSHAAIGCLRECECFGSVCLLPTQHWAAAPLYGMLVVPCTISTSTRWVTQGAEPHMARIVVMDDEPGMRALVAQVLEQAGHTVATATDGRAGNNLLRTYNADLAVIDLLMPEMEGIETILQIRREFPEMKIVAISGAGHSSAYLQMAVLLGAHTSLAKPFTAEGLLVAVNSALR